MLVLAIDTTTPSGSVALLEDEALLGEVDVESAATHSARLLRAVDFLLGAHGRDIKDVEAFAVAAGPGSFTGIRIGLGAAKALAFASGKPVAPVSTLVALATKLTADGTRLAAPLLDAKKGEIYAALFEAGRSGLKEIIPQGAYGPDEFFARLPARRVIAFAGSGVAAYRAKLLPYVRDKARFPRRTPFIAAEVGRIGRSLVLEGRAVGAAALEPIYFRRSQAEETCRS
ncbi:MAG TPA: tRNA (adenosine(37)-N6)-threonylcarbamoyltransferase complex dimerization subunit type 1 TsaB [Acidobacteriota bacterium]|nr:tRNA (adenosine(37)-N6)-threonylcarbamoyltransferase complex dimerization subunit type 1 TsaB [Acidobacteriota bacterium]